MLQENIKIELNISNHAAVHEEMSFKINAARTLVKDGLTTLYSLTKIAVKKSSSRYQA